MNGPSAIVTIRRSVLTISVAAMLLSLMLKTITCIQSTLDVPQIDDTVVHKKHKEAKFLHLTDFHVRMGLTLLFIALAVTRFNSPL
jgi:hypothetical protein